MKKVLWVDNDPVVRMAGKRLLESDGRFTCILAGSGIEALRLAAKDPPHLIVLDVIMPGIDGVETLKRLRAQNTGCPVIFMTAKAPHEMGTLDSTLGVSAIFQKPLDTVKFLSKIDSILGMD